jgi:hypothetical protein
MLASELRKRAGKVTAVGENKSMCSDIDKEREKITA